MINKFDGEYSFLSNFYPCNIKEGDIIYPTVEHAYQAMKTYDKEEKVYISKLSTPGKAKRAGKKVKLREDWEYVKVKIMKKLVASKFKNDNLRQKLINTKKQELVEGNNWHDYFWGVCNGKGKNVLGKILMNVRADIIQQEEQYGGCKI